MAETGWAAVQSDLDTALTALDRAIGGMRKLGSAGALHSANLKEHIDGVARFRLMAREKAEQEVTYGK